MSITQGGSEVGSMFVGFEKAELDAALKSLNTFSGLSLYMISGTTNRLYTFHDQGMTKDKLATQEQLITTSLQENSTLPLINLEKK